uniref:NR LBD domain-containing protein n=1 Tax=Ornithorhynchus anatinus TaxID=9258 RepID=A0A6I8PBC5_ORNAN
MSLMVFGLGWRSYKHVSGQMLYFAPDLILNEQRMKESSFYSLCLTMWQIPQEFVKLQVTQEEFLCMKALLLLNTSKNHPLPPNLLSLLVFFLFILSHSSIYQEPLLFKDNI